MLNKINRHTINKKITRLLNKKAGEREDLTKSDLDKALDLYTLSLNDLKKLAKLRGIKNIGGLTKEDLFYTLLRSEKSPRESSYLKYINNATNSDIKDRINHARMMAAKLGNALTGKERKTIREELFKLANTKFTKTTRERAIIHLVELTNTLYDKQKYHHSIHHDQTYYGIKDIEHLFNTINPNHYYKLFLARISFGNNFEEYEIRGDKDKNLSLKIISQLAELIDKKKYAR